MITESPQGMSFPSPEPQPFSAAPSLADSFAPGKNYSDPVVSVFDTPSKPYETAPADVQQILAENNLVDKMYECQLREIPEGASVGSGCHVTSFSSSYPTIEWVGKNYGPGRYALIFSWQTDTTAGKRPDKAIVEFRVSEKFRPSYEEFQFKKKVDRARSMRESVRSAKIEKELEDEAIYGKDRVESKSDSLSEIKKTVEFLNALGMTPGKGVEWDKVLTAMAPMVAAIIGVMGNRGDGDKSSDMIKMMFAMQSEANRNMLEIAKVQNGQGAGTSMIKEIGSMLLTAKDIKKELNEEKDPGVVDRIIGLVEQALPFIATMATMRKEQREKSVPFNMAKNFLEENADFQKLRMDPSLLIETVNKLDTTYGRVQTDQLLTVLGWPRPSECAGEVQNGSTQNQSPEGENAVAGEIGV